jgi:hypothetical protein
MNVAVCATCQKPKAHFLCGVCQEAICKQCVHFLEEGSFSFLKKIPDDLNKSTYCGSCFEERVVPELKDYDHVMTLAREVSVFLKSQGKETRLIKRLEDPIRVTDCADKEEILLRLAFLTVQAGFDTLVDVEITSEKVREGGYQRSKWQASGVPARVRRPTSLLPN